LVCATQRGKFQVSHSPDPEEHTNTHLNTISTKANKIWEHVSDTGEKKPKSNQNQTGMNVQSKEKQERVYKTELFLLQR